MVPDSRTFSVDTDVLFSLPSAVFSVQPRVFLCVTYCMMLLEVSCTVNADARSLKLRR